MEQNILDVLNTSKYKHKFPPRENIKLNKSELAAKGLLHSGAAIKLIVQTYTSNAEIVLNEFTEILLQNLSRLGLNSQQETLEVIDKACNEVLDESRDCTLNEFQNENMRTLALDHFNTICSPILAQLQRKVRLKDLDLGGKMSSVQIFGGQIGSLIVGSVNQSELTSTVANVIKQGGNEGELGRAIQDLIGVIGKLDERHKSEQAELFDLLKGFLKQIELSKDKRSPSVIKLIWERIVQLSQVSHEVEQVVQAILPMLPALLGR